MKNLTLSTCIDQKGRNIYDTLTYDSADDEIKSGSV